MIKNGIILFIVSLNFIISNICAPINSKLQTLQHVKANRIFSRHSAAYDYYNAFQCMDLKVHECRLHCKHQDADEAECEDPWPPTDSLNCYCYKKYKLIDGKVLHLNLTEDLYMDPEKLAIDLS